MNDRMDGSPKLPVIKPDRDLYPLVGPVVKTATFTLPGKQDLSDWVDLMEVIEMPCPVWPERDLVVEKGTNYRL